MTLSVAAKIFDPIFRETGFIDRRMHKSLAQIVSEADSATSGLNEMDHSQLITMKNLAVIFSDRNLCKN